MNRRIDQHNAPGPRSPYDALTQTYADEHPIDALVETRTRQSRLRRRIRRATRQLARALANRGGLWLHLEALIAEHRHLRERAYFDLGYEHGFAAGQADMVRLLLRVGPRVEQLAARLREQALLDGNLSAQERAVALLQAACAVGFEVGCGSGTRS